MFQLECKLEAEVGNKSAAEKSHHSDRNHLEHSQERMVSRLKAPPPMLRRVRCVPAYDVVRGDTYLKKHQAKVRL